MARDRGAATKGKRVAATAKPIKRSAKSRAGKAAKTPRPGAPGELPMPAADIGQDVLHGRAKAVIYAAVTKRLRS